tara:strand:- start:6064 stop:6783 length:720 start_codon:yes stop_codon:yes gene_type:complete
MISYLFRINKIPIKPQKMSLSNEIFIFLKNLNQNNNRDWFTENKNLFKTNESNVKKFGEEVKSRLDIFDSIEHFKLFRIYRDVRFSKNKTPYKTYFGLTWKRSKPQHRGGYYMHISPGNNFLSCGFWDPNSEDLKRIRQELIQDSNEFKNIITADPFHSIWGDLQGNELKTAPQGADKMHPDINLIRKKQYIFSIKYSDLEVCDPDFLNIIESALKNIRPFVDYMSEILSTDKNGEYLF